MIFIDFIFAFIIAILLSFLLVSALGWERPAREGPWAGFALLFILLFLLIWAGGVWVTPFGPAAGGVYWLPFLFIGIILALLIAALMPPHRPRTPSEAIKEAEEEKALATAFGIFFWILIIILIILIILNYI